MRKGIGTSSTQPRDQIRNTRYLIQGDPVDLRCPPTNATLRHGYIFLDSMNILSWGTSSATKILKLQKQLRLLVLRSRATLPWPDKTIPYALEDLSAMLSTPFLDQSWASEILIGINVWFCGPHHIQGHKAHLECSMTASKVPYRSIMSSKMVTC